MNKYLLTALLLSFSLFRVFAQDENPNPEFYNPEFNWHIAIPPAFHQVDPAVWDQQKVVIDSLQNDTLGIEDLTKTIVVFKSNDYNYFESNWQPYNEAERGDFKDHCRAVGEQLYKTFIVQMPDAKIDTAYDSQLINTLDFQKFVLKMTLPNGITLNSYMYSHLFGDKEFSANIFYVNDEQGSLMMEAWLYSTFH